MDQSRRARIFVTGSRGFIGSNLCQSLLRDGAELHVLSRPAPRGESRHAVEPGLTEARRWSADLTDPEDTHRVLQAIRPDVVFHLGGIVSGSRNRENVLPIVRNNFLTTLNLLNAVADGGAGRLVLAGSIEVPGPRDSGSFPCSPYAAAKWASNSYAAMYHALYNTPVVVARMCMVYGPRQWDSTKLIPYVIHSLLRGERPELSSGKRLVDWIYVDDVVAGLRAMAEAPGIEGCSIDLGSGKPATIRQVVDELVSIVDPGIEPNYGALPDRPMETEYVANLAESARLIDWAPATGLSEGLRRTVAWYKKQYQSRFAAAS